ncbi:MAG: ArsR family transcriptional regulator [Bacillus sp. (in: Bacteria)]|nr:ArsR family transcriptional regulator [Bacillus sp. (in: firmicutes)]
MADVNRLKIVDALSKECKSVNDIAERAEISQPLASHHLKTQRKAGIFRLEKSRANFNYYCIRDEMDWELIKKCKVVVKKVEENKPD